MIATTTRRSQPPAPETTAHHLSSSCHLHPERPFFTGFCPSCLRDRLSHLPTTTFNPQLTRAKSLSSSLLHHPEEDEERLNPTDATAKEDLHPQPKKSPGSLWVAASALTRRLRGNWRKKQEKPKSRDLGDTHKTTFEKHPLCGDAHIAKSRSFLAVVSKKPPLRPWDAQSETGGFALGRRSCDVDPRFSLEEAAGPRLSWDGEGLAAPGGTAQTREYYSERRRRSVDRSSTSSRRALAVDIDEVQGNSSSRVMPALGNELFHNNVRMLEKELLHGHSNELLFHDGNNLETEFAGPRSRKPTRRWGNAWRFLTHGRRDEEAGRNAHELSSNSNVCLRHSIDGSGLSMMEMSGFIKRRKEDLVMEENGNGLMKFYFTPTYRAGSSSRGILGLY